MTIIKHKEFDKGSVSWGSQGLQMLLSDTYKKLYQHAPSFLSLYSCISNLPLDRSLGPRKVLRMQKVITSYEIPVTFLSFIQANQMWGIPF